MSYIPSRADIIHVQLSPSKGHEQRGLRPAIVLSDYPYNLKSKLATICPITSKAKGYPFEVQIPDGFGVHGVILANQIRAIDLRERNIELRCKVSLDVYLKVFKMIITHIGPG